MVIVRFASNPHAANAGIAVVLSKTWEGPTGWNLEELIEEEPDAGLGNAGLGRLAACFIDSLATLQYPGIGYGVRYKYGIFRQSIHDGWQLKRPDNWLRNSDPWQVVRPAWLRPRRHRQSLANLVMD